MNACATPVTTPTAGRRWAPADGKHLRRLLAVAAGLHLLGWGVLGLVVVPRGFTVDGQVFGWGLGATAYLFGVRHAFDADHIAVIDGTTRHLTAEERLTPEPSSGRSAPRPLSVGFWFSLGHSTVVFAMAVLVATGARFAGSLAAEGSTAHQVLGTVGTTAAGVFLWVVGIVNLVTLLGILRTWSRRRRGLLDDDALRRTLVLEGVLARIVRRSTSRIRTPRQVYPVGLLMGMGFDTATEVALLVLAGSAATALPWYAVLVLPVLFAAGMSLFDTLDGAFMTAAYDWALVDPLRRLSYNGVVTAISVAVALGIGTVQLASVAHDELGLDDRLSTALAAADTRWAGYAVAGVFTLVWVTALTWWRRASRPTTGRARSARPPGSTARTRSRGVHHSVAGRRLPSSGGRGHGSPAEHGSPTS